MAHKAAGGLPGRGARAGSAFSWAPHQGWQGSRKRAEKQVERRGSLSSWGRKPGPGMARLAQRGWTRPGELSSGASFLLREAPVAAPRGGRRGQGGLAGGGGASTGTRRGRERRAARAGRRPGGRRPPACPSRTAGHRARPLAWATAGDLPSGERCAPARRRSSTGKRRPLAFCPPRAAEARLVPLSS